jgi:hypothetical protein
LGGMFLVSNKKHFKNFYLLALILGLIPIDGFSQAGVVNAIGSGRDSSEAISSLLRSVVAKYFKDEPQPLTKAVLQSEITPNGSAFVQSYKILEGGRSGSVSIGANVDLDVIRALLKLTPAQLEESSAKAIVIVRGARIPDAVTSGMKVPPTTKLNPYQVLENSAKDRFLRRQFEVVSPSVEDLQLLPEGEDVASPEVLRGLGAKVSARIALGISSKYESFENENSHNLDQRIVVSATLVDVKRGTILGKSTVLVTDPKSKRDQYFTDLQRLLGEEGKDLFHDVFVAAGKRYLKIGDQEEFAVIRVQNPPNALLVGKFRILLEGAKGIKSVVEYNVRRGAFDLAVRPPLTAPVASKMLKGLSNDELTISLVDSVLDNLEKNEKAPVVVVKLVTKTANPLEKPGEGDLSVAPY